MVKILLFFLINAAPVGAQFSLGAEAGPDAFIRAEELKLNQREEDVFANAFALENSTAALCEVFESTSPAYAAASYMRRGIYRRELLMLFAIARDSKIPFKTLAKEREKGVALRAMAEKNKVDLMKLFRQTDELQKKIEIRAAFIDISTTAFIVEDASAAPKVGISTAAVPSAGLQ
jgi:hypothetical protein